MVCCPGRMCVCACVHVSVRLQVHGLVVGDVAHVCHTSGLHASPPPWVAPCAAHHTHRGPVKGGNSILYPLAPVQIVGPSREGEQLRSSLLHVLRQVIASLVGNRVSCWEPGRERLWASVTLYGEGKR